MEELAYNLGANLARVVPQIVMRSYEDAVIAGKSEKYFEDAEGLCVDLIDDLCSKNTGEDRPSNQIDVYSSDQKDEIEALEDLDMVVINPNEAYRRRLSIGKVEEIGTKVLKNYSTAAHLLAESGEDLGDAFMDAFMERYIKKYDLLEGESREKSEWSSRKERREYSEDLYEQVKDSMGSIGDELGRIELEEGLELKNEDEEIVVDHVRKEICQDEGEGEEKPHEQIGRSRKTNYHELHIGKKAKEAMDPGVLEELTDGAKIFEKDGRISFKETYERGGEKITRSVEIEAESGEKKNTEMDPINPQANSSKELNKVHEMLSLGFPEKEDRKAEA